MKNKRTIILISVFATLACIMVIFSTVFSLSTIEINNASTRFTSASVLQNVTLKKGNSVFALDKKNAIENLEKNIPYGKFSIEVKFPNKVIVHALERTPVFVSQKDGKKWLLDIDLKILEECESNLLQAIDTDIEIKETVGNFCTDSLYVNLINSFKKYNFGADKILTEILDIKIDKTTKIATIKTLKKYNFIIENIENDLDEKISHIVGLYESDKLAVIENEKNLTVSKDVTGEIKIV